MSLDPTRLLMTSPHADLKSRHSGDILVLPERAIRLGGSGAEILRILDAPRDARSIVGTMRTRYPDTSEIEGEVLAFLGEMLAIGALVYGTETLEVNGDAIGERP